MTDPDAAPVAAAPGGAVQPASDDVQAASTQGGDQQNGQQEQQPDWKEQLKSTIMRMIFFYMVMNWMKGNCVVTNSKNNTRY